jgi:hypothetical protein
MVLPDTRFCILGLEKSWIVISYCAGEYRTMVGDESIYSKTVKPLLSVAKKYQDIQEIYDEYCFLDPVPVLPAFNVQWPHYSN